MGMITQFLAIILEIKSSVSKWHIRSLHFLLFLVLSCDSQKITTNNTITDIFLLLKDVRRQILTLSEQIQEHETRIFKQMSRQEEKTSQQIQELSERVRKVEKQVEQQDVRATEQINGIQKNIQGLGLRTDEKIQLLMEQKSETNPFAEKGIEKQIERLDVQINQKLNKLSEKTESLEKEIAQHEVKVSQHVQELKTELIERVHLHERKLAEQMQVQEVELPELIQRMTNNITEQIEQQGTNMILNLQSQDAQLQAFENYLVQQDLPRELFNLTSKVERVDNILTGVLPGKDKDTAAPSCEWLDNHFFNLRNGMYWTNSGDAIKLVYCDMESIQGKLGSMRNPGQSCKMLKESDRSFKSGLYWVALDQPTQVFCDMETDNGGWIEVGSASVENETEGKEVDYTKILSNDVSELSSVKNNRFLLGTQGLKKLKDYTSFNQIRFYCHKPGHGRTLHIKTTENTLGRLAVDFLLENSKARPQSCTSYERLDDDTSILGQYCSEWNAHKWSDSGERSHGAKLYDLPMYTLNFNNHFSLFPGELECDDYRYHDRQDFSSVGQWAFFVR